MVLLPVLFLPVIVFFITLNKLRIIFLPVVATLVIVSGGWSGWIFPRYSRLMHLVMNLNGECEVQKCNVNTTRWRNYLHSLTINTKDFGSDTIIYHLSTMERLSKGNYIWSLVVNNDLVQLQNYHERFILPLKHHPQIAEASVQDVATCLATRRSEEYSSTLV